MDYQVMPDLTAEEYSELKADIAQRGVMVPVEMDEQGNVLDGHHRLRACEELGISEYPKVIRAGLTEEGKRAHARKLNMARRHLTQEQRRELIRGQLRETPEISDRQMASALNVSPTTVGTIRRQMEGAGQLSKLDSSIGADGKERPRQVERHLAPDVTPPCEGPSVEVETEIPPAPIDEPPAPEPIDERPVSVFAPTRREERALQRPEVVELMKETGAGPIAAVKQVEREARAERKAYALSDEIPDDACRLFAADIRGGLPEIEDESIDVIITDPPYPREYLPLYEDLSRLAARVMKPGGSLIVMTGQSYLPEVMARLSESMTYHWCMAYLTPGGQSPQLFHKKVNTFWKPVLWYVKGEYDGDWSGDVLKSPVNDNDKRFHEWGQSIGGMREIVERFTDPGAVVLDPFLGGGTTGVVTVCMGRRFVGADIEQSNIDIAWSRISEAWSSERCQG